MALAVTITMSVTSLAQAKTDEDYDKLMKAVGAANGAMRGAAKEQNTAGVSAEAKKMVALLKDVQAFWKAGADMTAAMGHMKQLGGTCQTCHAKYRDKDANRFIIKKGECVGHPLKGCPTSPRRWPQS